MANKEWTGERLEQHITNETMLEHLHRYAFALDIAKGKDVLDIACGEGYGCSLLADYALNVTGVDIDADTIHQAKNQYSNKRISFITGSIEAIPCPDKSVDLVTCFETLEHITNQEKAMQEIKRVLKSDGILVISTPDKANYTDKTGYQNPFHLKELYENEFRDLISRYFTHTCFFQQQSLHASLLLPENDNSISRFYTGDYSTILKNDPPVMYRICMASDHPLQRPDGSLFFHQQSVEEQLQAREKAVKQTITYRTGHLLLAPFKAIRSLFRK